MNLPDCSLTFASPLCDWRGYFRTLNHDILIERENALRLYREKCDDAYSVNICNQLIGVVEMEKAQRFPALYTAYLSARRELEKAKALARIEATLARIEVLEKVESLT